MAQLRPSEIFTKYVNTRIRKKKALNRVGLQCHARRRRKKEE
jgi:hypothetical protein